MKIILSCFLIFFSFLIGIFVGGKSFRSKDEICKKIRFDINCGRLNYDSRFSINGDKNLIEVGSYYEKNDHKILHGALMRFDQDTNNKEYILYCHGEDVGYIGETILSDPPKMD